MNQYDFTGSDPLYRRSNVRFAVFDNNQPIDFEEPVYADSIVVRWLKEDGNTETIVKDLQWVINASNIDHDAMSEAKLIQPGFVAQLVDGITINDNISQDRVYAIEYQAFKLQYSQFDYGNDGPLPTPGLMRELVEKITFLTSVSDPLNNVTSDTLDGIVVLEEDLTGILADNLIENERHSVNVPANKQVIRPGAGSFYEHDVVLVNEATGGTLVKGIDYVIVGLDRPKTRVAEHTSGVFNYIFLLRPYVGNINVTYRAFGGDVTINDINAIKDVLADLVRMMSEGLFLTADTLPFSPSIVNILTRMGILEDHVRHFITAHHRYTANTDGKHWFTIASLHRDLWSPDVVSAEQVNLFLRSPSKSWSYEVALSVNLDRQHEQIRANVISSLDKYNHFSIGEYENIINRDIPEVRVIWNEGSGERSGALIQIGMDMKAGQSEMLSVYDKSGNSSLIEIRPNIPGEDTVYDDNVTLPNDDAWSTITPESKISRVIMAPEEGYLLWGGAVPLVQLEDNFVELNHTIGTDDFNLANVSRTVFHVYDRYKDKYLVVSQDHQWDDRNILHGTVIVFADDLCGLEYRIQQTPLGYKLEAKSEMGTQSLNNERFDLRQIVVHF